MAEPVYIGYVTHYFDRISVAMITLTDDVELGDWLGFVWDGELLFEQEVSSMQINHQAIDYANAGEEIALQTVDGVKRGVEVYRL